MRVPNRRERTLLVLLAVVAVLVLYLRGNESAEDALDAAQPGGGPGSGEAPAVQLARLTQDPESYDPQGRNLFAYGSPPRPKHVELPPPPPPPPPRERIEPPVQTAPPPPPPPPRPTAPTPPKPSFAYLGFLGPKDDRIAVFEQGEHVVLARAGDVVQSQFRVLEFKYEVVVLGFTDERFAGKTTELTVKSGPGRKKR